MGNTTLSNTVFGARLFPGFTFPGLLRPQNDENIRKKYNLLGKTGFIKKIFFYRGQKYIVFKIFFCDKV